MVLLEDLASHFGMRTQDAINRLQDLLAEGSLTGKCDQGPSVLNSVYVVVEICVHKRNRKHASICLFFIHVSHPEIVCTCTSCLTSLSWCIKGQFSFEEKWRRTQISRVRSPNLQIVDGWKQVLFGGLSISNKIKQVEKQKVKEVINTKSLEQ